jgi:hypothetical protein
MHRKILIALPLLALAVPADAVEIRLTGTLLSSCVLSLATPGQLAISGDAGSYGSENVGGLAATMTVVAIGAVPSISFTAPAMDAPAGFSPTAQAQIRYISLGGSNQGYTSAASSSSAVTLLDTFTIHGRILSSEGFQSGSYAVRTTATCQQ